MCGIAAIVHAGSVQDAPERLGRMIEALRHRGPDDSGIATLAEGRAVLGNTRLAIRDLSPAGHLPMQRAVGSDEAVLTMAYNGEVYNTTALRSELERLGHLFYSTGDAEVVLAAYSEWGSNFVARLDGIFGLMIHDPRTNRVVIARDRFGVKPLYFAASPGIVIVSSEVRGVRTSGLVADVVNHAAIEGCLMLGSVPEPMTIVRGIEAFPPAHIAEIDVASARLTESSRYWSHADSIVRAQPLRSADIGEATRECLKKVVTDQLVSDVPIGLFLSGGVDSSTLAAVARAGGADDVRSVSISFSDALHNEGSAAEAIAARFGLTHNDRRIEASELALRLPEIVAAMDQPTVDGVNTYFVSETAREAGLTVALSGLGSDELFGGYATFHQVPRLAKVQGRIYSIPGISNAVRAMGSAPHAPYRLSKLAAWASPRRDLATAYATSRGLLSPRMASTLLESPVELDPFEQISTTSEVGNGHSTLDVPARISLLESQIYMKNQLLRDTDAMSMAHSLEVRVPFLANDVVTLANQTRSLWANNSKAPVKSARSAYFPPEAGMSRKQGFVFPFGAWLKGPLEPLIAKSNPTGDLTASPGYRQLVARFQSGHLHWSAVWIPFLLDSWLEQHGLRGA